MVYIENKNSLNIIGNSSIGKVHMIGLVLLPKFQIPHLWAIFGTFLTLLTRQDFLNA